MTKTSIFLGLAALAAVSCERISPSVSVPGYAEKQAAAQKAAGQPLGGSVQPPSFFPQTTAPVVAPHAAGDHGD